MIILENNELKFSFPEVHQDAKCSIDFQRTLRIPDDNREYPLPPGLGNFPMYHIDDYKDKLPQKWLDHGGVFLPMYQTEALWVNFSGSYPCAVKIATGKIDAITGDEWTGAINKQPQDYAVIPEQPWLDGYCVDEGFIRQFVAMPLGKGFTAEEQITGKAEHGGIQIIVYPMKRDKYEEMQKEELSMDEVMCCGSMDYCMEDSSDMGLAPGGLMRQEIYDDPYGFDVWDLENSSRSFIHIANSLNFKKITGHAPPTEPVTAQQYENAGLPWFDYYAKDLDVLKGSSKLASMDSVAAKVIKQGKGVLEGNQPVNPKNISKLGIQEVVREEDF